MTAEDLSVLGTTSLAERTIETITGEIKLLHNQAQRMALSYAVEIGRRLVEAKEVVPYGTWGNYLKETLEYSQSTANNFMRIFEEYGAGQLGLFGGETESQTLGNLTYTKALALLALPAEEREEFAEQNDVEAMSSRELAAALKEKETAQAAAKNAEESRLKMEADMRMANERLSAADDERKIAAEKLESTEDELIRAREELLELRAQPVEIVGAAVPDKKALDAARDEGRDEALASAAEAEKKANEKLKAAKAAKQRAEEQYQTAAAEITAMQSERESLKKQLSVAGNENVAAFKFHFGAAQENINKMMLCIAKMAESGDMEHHDKLLCAVLELARVTEKEATGRLEDGEG